MQRNVFLELRLDAFARKLLPKFNVDCAVRGERGYLLGDAAFELAHLFERETRSPMKDGAVSPQEPDGLRVISILLDHLLGPARAEGEICCFTLPGDSVDPERNFIYHRGALENVLRGLGYSPRPVPAGQAVAIAELKEQDYTGIALSCGAGLFDVCVVYKGVPALSFSTPRGGDWIDLHAARALGVAPGQVRVAKEGGMDLHAPKDRSEVAIAMYARSLLRDTLETVRRRFNEAEHVPTFTQAVDLVVAGGTAQIGGFLPLLQEEFDKLDFPVPVAQIRLARDPLSAAVEGCLQAAVAETRALSEPPLQVAPAALDRAAIGALRPADREAFRRLRGA
jgi:hypothetical protein